jgi:hypothetical protein
MPRLIPILVAALLASVAFVPTAAEARSHQGHSPKAHASKKHRKHKRHHRTNIRIGIGDQQVAMFDNPAFKRAKLKRVRYFVRWDVMSHRADRLKARAFIKRARKSHIRVFLHPSTNDLTPKKAHLPRVKTYKRQMHRFVRYFRKLGVRDFGVWNEENHKSQPTYRSPKAAARYFKVMWREVHRRCKSCDVVALDVLDQTGVERYMKRFYRHLSRRWRHRAKLVGIHNYGDVNRKRTKFTRNIIHMARRYNRRTRFWFTETGGIVNFGKNFPCSERRAASRTKTMFRLAKRYYRSGVRRVYIYNWTGAGCDARWDSGFTDVFGNPRPAYKVLRRALRNFKR